MTSSLRSRMLLFAVLFGAVGFISSCGAHRTAATGFIAPTSPSVRMRFRTPSMSLTPQQGAPSASWVHEYNLTQTFCGTETDFLVKISELNLVSVQFHRDRQEHQLVLDQWSGKKWTPFCELFFERKPRDRTTYGWFEHTFTVRMHHGTDDQERAIVDRAVKDVLLSIDAICETHGESSCGYTLELAKRLSMLYGKSLRSTGII